MQPVDSTDSFRRYLVVHPLVVRLAHWINAVAIACMAMSGWAIYNASPIFAFTFPVAITAGGWLGGAIAIHFAAMWLLVLNGFVYVVFSLSTGHFRRAFLPLHGRDLLRDLRLALTFRLTHVPGVYNAVQRLMYIGVLLCGFLVMASGLAVWKPVQLDRLAALFGGYDTARVVHFLAMSGIVIFVLIHLLLVLIVPGTLLPMLTGRVHNNVDKERAEP